MPEEVAQIPAQFGLVSWIVIALYMAATTWIGALLSGKQATIRDFFLGGRKLPWFAVSGSIIATEVSAMTLVGVPAFLWAEATGDMRYAALALGGIVSRIIVGIWMVPKYYERDLYSPYEYIGHQLGPSANRLTSLLFMAGGVLGQGTRVLLTAVVLGVVTGWGIYNCILAVGIVAVIWTLMGGITTVIWTDVIQFFVFVAAAAISLVVVFLEFRELHGPDSLSFIITTASEAGKFRWLDLNPDIRLDYTLVAALIASTIGGLGAYGTDQLIAQRIFCCKGVKEARKAIIWSIVGQFLMLICLLVGVALWAFYKRLGVPGIPSPDEAAQIGENTNRLLAVFIKYRVPAILGGLMTAGIFAAAISSLDSILAALSQQTLHAMRPPKNDGEPDAKSDIFLSRLFVVLWAFVLCGMAAIFQAALDGKGLIIELALSVVGLVGGSILGIFALAFFPRLGRGVRGLTWCAALAIMTVFALVQSGGVALRIDTMTFWFAPFPETEGATSAGLALEYIRSVWAFWTLAAATVLLAVTAALRLMPDDKWVLVKFVPFLAVIWAIYLIQYPAPGAIAFHDYAFGFTWSYFTEPAGGGETAYNNVRVGWPWYSPIGALVTILSARALAKRG